MIEKPDLKVILEQRLQDLSPEEFKEFFGVTPSAAWQKKAEAGIDAAQRMIDKLFADAPPALADIVIPEPAATPAPELPKLNPKTDVLIPALPEKKPGELTDAQVAQFVNMMRPRVTAAPDALPIDVLRAVFDGSWSRKVSMLVPCGGPIPSRVVQGMLAQVRRQGWLGVEMTHDTLIQRARNLCAQQFLNSEAEWSWWHDADMICPFGDPGFFLAPPGKGGLGLTERPGLADRLRIMAISRLLSHKKTIVGGTYAQRRKSPRLVSQIDLSPRGPEDQEYAKALKEKGPIDKLIEVDYVATGCALVHRSVYEAIMKKFPDRAPKRAGEPWDFFGHDVGVCGEDIAFGHLAKEAGHQSYLDAGLFCVHVGNYAFFPGE